MAEKVVEVPQRDLDAVEKARVELYHLINVELGIVDLPTMIKLNNILAPVWEVGNRKYPEVLALFLAKED